MKAKSVVHEIVNLPKATCEHLLNENHNLMHRIFVGTIIIFFGVGITKVTLMSPSLFAHVFGDALGYLLHGIGSVPYVQWIANIGEK